MPLHKLWRSRVPRPHLGPYLPPHVDLRWQRRAFERKGKHIRCIAKYREPSSQVSVLVDESSRQIAHLRGCRPFSEFEPAVSLRVICLSFPDLATVGTRCASPLRMHASNGGPPIPRCRCCRGEQKAHLSVFVSVRLKTRLAFLRHAEGKRVARQRLILACETGLVAWDAVLQDNAKIAAAKIP